MTEDVLESGPRGTARWWWVVAAVVAAALAVSTLDAGEGEPVPVASETPAPTPEEEPEPNTTYGVPTPEVSYVAEVAPTPDGPTRFAAPRWTGSHDPLLVTGGGILLRVRPGNQTGRQVRHVGAVTSWLVEVAGGTVVVESYGDHGDKPYAAFVPAGGSESEPLGEVADVYAAANGRDVWVADHFPGMTDPATVRLVDPRTGRTRTRVTLPKTTALVGEVGRGLVLQSLDEDGGVAIWDRGTRAYVRRWPGHGTFGVHADHLVLHRLQCSTRCFTIVRADGTERATMHAHHPPSVSPDGRWAAAYEPMGEGMRLVVHALDTGAATTLDHSHVATQVRVAFAWGRDSRNLYVSVSPEADRGEVAVWRVGAPGLALLSGYYAEDLAAE